MNYLIISEMRSGSSFVGDLLAAHGLPYFNELFTPEICRRSSILPRRIDNKISDEVLRQVWSTPDAGFKLIYGQATPEVWAALTLASFVKVIHLVRDDLLEQYCSIQYLERVGVSSNVDGQCMGNDGKPATPDLTFTMTFDLEHLATWCRRTLFFRQYVWYAFKDSHQYLEMPFPEMFNDESERALCNFLSPGKRFRRAALTKHQPTPRPPAADMVTNMQEAADMVERIRQGACI